MSGTRKCWSDIVSEAVQSVKPLDTDIRDLISWGHEPWTMARGTVRAGQVFLDLLGQLLAGGQCVIDPDMRHPRDHAPGTAVIGYREDDSIYLLPDLVLREINRAHPLRFTKAAIGSQLREDGVLIPGASSLTVQKSVRGHVVRLWRLKAASPGCEGCEPCEADD